MPVARITKSAVDKLPLGAVLWDSDVIGFGVRRHRSEAKHYLLRFRFAGRQTFKRIGTHGSPWTADTARQEAHRWIFWRRFIAILTFRWLRDCARR